VSGLTTAVGDAEVTDAYRSALLLAAGVTAFAGPVMLVGHTTSPRTMMIGIA
jgi:hypothetical protein